MTKELQRGAKNRSGSQFFHTKRGEADFASDCTVERRYNNLRFSDILDIPLFFSPRLTINPPITIIARINGPEIFFFGVISFQSSDPIDQFLSSIGLLPPKPR